MRIPRREQQLKTASNRSSFQVCRIFVVSVPVLCEFLPGRFRSLMLLCECFDGDFQLKPSFIHDSVVQPGPQTPESIYRIVLLTSCSVKVDASSRYGIFGFRVYDAHPQFKRTKHENELQVIESLHAELPSSYRQHFEIFRENCERLLAEQTSCEKHNDSLGPRRFGKKCTYPCSSTETMNQGSPSSRFCVFRSNRVPLVFRSCARFFGETDFQEKKRYSPPPATIELKRHLLRKNRF